MSVPEDKQVSAEATSFHLFPCDLLSHQRGVAEMLALGKFTGSLLYLHNNHKCVGMETPSARVQAQRLISVETQVGALWERGGE